MNNNSKVIQKKFKDYSEINIIEVEMGSISSFNTHSIRDFVSIIEVRDQVWWICGPNYLSIFKEFM